MTFTSIIDNIQFTSFTPWTRERSSPLQYHASALSLNSSIRLPPDTGSSNSPRTELRRIFFRRWFHKIDVSRLLRCQNPLEYTSLNEPTGNHPPCCSTYCTDTYTHNRTSSVSVLPVSTEPASQSPRDRERGGRDREREREGNAGVTQITHQCTPTPGAYTRSSASELSASDRPG